MIQRSSERVVVTGVGAVTPGRQRRALDLVGAGRGA